MSIGTILKINIELIYLIMNKYWCKKLHPTDLNQEWELIKNKLNNIAASVF